MDPGVDAAWDVEINHRLDAIEAGQTNEREGFAALDAIEVRLREAGVIAIAHGRRKLGYCSNRI